MLEPFLAVSTPNTLMLIVDREGLLRFSKELVESVLAHQFANLQQDWQPPRVTLTPANKDFEDKIFELLREHDIPCVPAHLLWKNVIENFFGIPLRYESPIEIVPDEIPVKTAGSS